jgi:hypothetical protein
MKTILLLLALTIGNSYSATIPINAVPFTISRPGTYELTSNLTSLVAGNAITINVPVAGTVVLNLNGFTINWNQNVGASGGTNGIAILYTNSPQSVVTIKNGTIGSEDQGFWTGIAVNGNPPNGSNENYLANLTIDNVTFAAERWSDVSLNQVNSATVSNCTFLGLFPQSAVQYGIQDTGSQGGNRYVNDSFDGGQTNMIAVDNNGPAVLTRAEFAPAN